MNNSDIFKILDEKRDLASATGMTELEIQEWKSRLVIPERLRDRRNRIHILAGYIMCILFTEEESLTGKATSGAFHESSCKSIKIDHSFLVETWSHVCEFVMLSGVQKVRNGRINMNLGKMTDDTLGQNLWYSRQGHGTGFWDLNDNQMVPKRVADLLHHSAQSLNEYNVYCEGKVLRAERADYDKATEFCTKFDRMELEEKWKQMSKVRGKVTPGEALAVLRL